MRKNFPRKRLAAVAAALLAGLAVAGCGGPGGPGESGGNGSGSTFIQVINADPTTLNPAITSSAPDQMVSCKIFEGLVAPERGGGVAPELAKSWEISDDGMKYTFHLQDGVKWQDGEPFTSADVVWTFKNVTSEYSPRAATVFSAMTSVTAPDDSTVVLQLAKPFAPFLELLGCSNAAILPEHVYGNGPILDNPRNLENPVGTGPYTLAEWVRGDHVTLKKNDDYWDEGLPHLDEVKLRIIADPQSAAAAFEAGEVDHLNSYILDLPTVERFKDTPGVTLEDDVQPPLSILLMFNLNAAPFDDVKVRQAFAHLIDRESIVKLAYRGLGEVADSPFDPALLGHDPDVSYDALYPSDVQAAEDLLDEAGYTPDGDGTRLKVTLSYTSIPTFPEVTEIIKQDLAKAGVVVEMESLERTTMLDQVFGQHDFQMTLQRYATGGDIAVGVERIYGSDYIGELPFTNVSGYSNPTVDRLLAEGASELDEDKRAGIYQQAEDIIAAELPVITVGQQPSFDLAQDYVEGLWLGADTVYDGFIKHVSVK
jgi:peptide/nickel transport system substrate-binding protein